MERPVQIAIAVGAILFIFIALGWVGNAVLPRLTNFYARLAVSGVVGLSALVLYTVLVLVPIYQLQFEWRPLIITTMVVLGLLIAQEYRKRNGRHRQK